MTIRHHRWWPRRCTRCGRRSRLAYHGWCHACVRRCCGAGEGPRVGLPVPADIDRAVRQLDHHLRHHGYRPRACWTCALLTADCPECDTPLSEMKSELRAQHRTVAQWIAIGCELYVTPAVRAAAAPLAR